MSGGNFGAIGLALQDPQALMTLFDSLVANAVDEGTPVGEVRHLSWTDPSGASLVFHVSGKSIICVTPTFSADDRSTWRVATSAGTCDQGCEHCGGALCDVLDPDGELVTRTTVEWASFQPYRKWLQEPRTFSLKITAFAHQGWCFASKDAFYAGQSVAWRAPDSSDPAPSTTIQLADNAFLPEGGFADDSATMHERAIALCAGEIESCQRLVNQATSREFLRLRLRTLPGSLDVLIDPENCEGDATPGSIALVRAWFVGRPDVPPPPPASRSWLSRLIGR